MKWNKLNISLLQTILAPTLIYVGWILLVFIIEPRGSNWMWKTEVNFFIIFLIIIIFLGNFTIKNINYRLFAQVIFLIIFLSTNYMIRPFRNIFFGICALFILLVGYFIHKIYIDKVSSM